MAVTELSIIKSWFQTGDYPTEAQFWSAFDSFFHKLENIPPERVEGLIAAIADKADLQAFNYHINNSNNPHSTTKEQVGLGNIPNSISNAIDQNKEDQLATSAALYALYQQIKNSSPEEIVMSSNGNYIIPIANLLEYIIVIPDSDIRLAVGSVENGSDILAEFPVPGGVPSVIGLNIYSHITDKAIFFSGLDANTIIRFYKR